MPSSKAAPPRPASQPQLFGISGRTPCYRGIGETRLESMPAGGGLTQDGPIILGNNVSSSKYVCVWQGERGFRGPQGNQIKIHSLSNIQNAGVLRAQTEPVGASLTPCSLTPRGFQADSWAPSVHRGPLAMQIISVHASMSSLQQRWKDVAIPHSTRDSVLRHVPHGLPGDAKPLSPKCPQQ